MIALDIPGYGLLQLMHLVMDYNGTLAVDGRMLDGVADRLVRLAEQVDLHIITADTFGKVEQATVGLPCQVHILPPGKQTQAKHDYIHSLGAHHTAAIGNGRNDRMMLKAAALGIAVVLAEGASMETLAGADVVCTSVTDGLELLCQPLRLTATLRG